MRQTSPGRAPPPGRRRADDRRAARPPSSPPRRSRAECPSCRPDSSGEGRGPRLRRQGLRRSEASEAVDRRGGAPRLPQRSGASVLSPASGRPGVDVAPRAVPGFPGTSPWPTPCRPRVRASRRDGRWTRSHYKAKRRKRDTPGGSTGCSVRLARISHHHPRAASLDAVTCEPVQHLTEPTARGPGARQKNTLSFGT